MKSMNNTKPLIKLLFPHPFLKYFLMLAYYLKFKLI